jgi:heme/copper-type cytochrome/quinol oxidase subunit 2
MWIIIITALVTLCYFLVWFLWRYRRARRQNTVMQKYMNTSVVSPLKLTDAERKALRNRLHDNDLHDSK